MKKFLSLVCIFSLITGLTACSNSDEATKSKIIQTETMEESVTETEIETEEVSETESETAEETKEVLANAVSAFRNRDFATAISGISEFLDMIFYGTDGEKYSGEQLKQSLEGYFTFRRIDADNFQSKTLKGDMTSWFLYN